MIGEGFDTATVPAHTLGAPGVASRRASGAATLDKALHGATDKLDTLLTSKFERLKSQETRETVRGR